MFGSSSSCFFACSVFTLRIGSIVVRLMPLEMLPSFCLATLNKIDLLLARDFITYSSLLGGRRSNRSVFPFLVNSGFTCRCGFSLSLFRFAKFLGLVCFCWRCNCCWDAASLFKQKTSHLSYARKKSFFAHDSFDASK